MEGHLRDWQAKAWIACNASQDRDFFVEATPGAGKTTFGCYVAAKKFDHAAATRVIVVVPTTALKDQWATAMHGHGIDLEPSYNSGSPWPNGFNGIAVTYHQVASDAATLAYLCNRTSTVVILDEVHHCGDEATWGGSVKEAFSSAAFRLSLSGTPFRSDNESIPFLRYVDGKAQPDVIYGYGEGLRDGICRHVFFPRQGGTAEWSDCGGKIRKHTFDDVLAEAERRDRLRTALTTTGWMSETLVSANNQLELMRRDDPDAAGLVIAMDVQEAGKIRKLMASRLGIEPVCVSSDDPHSHPKIRAFRTSNAPWIIAIKMVSEGVDIPRLRVGVYATMVSTELFFRQAVGRFVRVEPGHDDPTAMVYIPDDPILRGYAMEIRQQRIHELERELYEERKRLRDDSEIQGHESSMFVPLSSEAEHKGTLANDASFTPEELEIAERHSGGMCNPIIAAMILKSAGVISHAEPTAPVATVRKADKRKKLRELNAKLVGAIASRTNQEHSHVNADLNRACGISSVSTASVEQLERRLKFAERMMQVAMEKTR